MVLMGQDLPANKKFGFSKGCCLGGPIVIGEENGKFCSGNNEEEENRVRINFFTPGVHNGELEKEFRVGEGDLPSYIVG